MPMDYRCAICGTSIADAERWEYEHGAYPVGTPEDAKPRVHSRCVSKLLREVISALGRVPHEQRDDLFFEI